MQSSTDLIIRGAYEHTLKHIDLRLPKNKFIVITGPSGSGKSSLVFDTIFLESQRLFFESLALYSKSYIRLQEPAKVGAISHLCPSISIDQKTRILSRRSTVGTVSEIMDYLRLLYARFGRFPDDAKTQHVRITSRSEFKRLLDSLTSSSKVWIAAPIVENRKGTFQHTFQELLQKGYVYVWVDGKQVLLSPDLSLEKHKRHTIYVLVERLKTSHIPSPNQLSEIAAHLKALNTQEAVCLTDDQEIRFMLQLDDTATPTGPKLEPHHFSFNSPFGHCPDCKGLGENTTQEVCSPCQGSRINARYGSVLYKGLSFKEASLFSLAQMHAFFKQDHRGALHPVEAQMFESFEQKLSILIDLGLGYLTLTRSASTLSGGETQRLRIGSLITLESSGMMYIFDEPSIGLHPMNTGRLLAQLKALSKHNTVIVVEHDMDTILNSEFLVELGPGGGHHGGEVVYVGDTKRFSELKKVQRSKTHAFVKTPHHSWTPVSAPVASKNETFKNITFRNLKIDALTLPLGELVSIVGVSGSGKSSLLFDRLIPQFKEKQHSIYEVNQEPIGKSSRSAIVTYLEIYQFIRSVFAASLSARIRGLSQRDFSFNTGAFRCEKCKGVGYQRFELSFLPQSEMMCEQCSGNRFQDFVLRVRYNDKNIAQVLDMTLEEGAGFFHAYSKVSTPLQHCLELGLGYLKMGQLTSTLSGGEAQRLKLIFEISKRKAVNNIYCLDEPTTGLSSYDIQFLLKLFSRLIEQGNSVFVIEHHPVVIAASHHIIELGPGGGPEGGMLIAQGSPDQIRSQKQSIIRNFI